MNTGDVNQKSLSEDEEIMAKYIELKAAILEETRGKNGFFPDDSNTVRSYSTSYLSYYGAN